MNPKSAKLGWCTVSWASISVQLSSFMSSFPRTNNTNCSWGSVLVLSFSLWSSVFFSYTDMRVPCQWTLGPTAWISALCLIYTVSPPIPLVSDKPGAGWHICPYEARFNSLHHTEKLYLFEDQFSQGACPVVGLLGHMVALFLVF